jgi:hypothetical protein
MLEDGGWIETTASRMAANVIWVDEARAAACGGAGFHAPDPADRRAAQCPVRGKGAERPTR